MRVHYRRVDDAYSTEYCKPSNCVPYWKMKGGGKVAVPIGRDTVSDPLHKCVRQDLVEVGTDPEVEDRVV